jgi:hypothetical protein
VASPAFVAVSAVRDYLELNAVASSSKYTDGTIGSNIRAASDLLQRVTGRQWEAQSGVTKTFTTNGRASIALPGLRTATSVTLQGTALVADSTYYLTPDAAQTGVYTGIAFRAYGGDYRSNPEWFDRNLDHWLYPARGGRWSLPNDLQITGDWGLLAADYPDPLLHATKVLAGWYTKRPDSLLANVSITPEGNLLNFSQYPPEVADALLGFVGVYRISDSVVVSVG